MINIATLISAKRKDALRDYVLPIITYSSLFGHRASLRADALFNNCSIVSTSPDDESHPFTAGFGASASESVEWLVNSIIAFLRSETLPIALIDDLVGSSSDPMDDVPVAFWTYGNRIVWPITNDMASVEACTEALAWAAGRHQIVFLCSPVDLSDIPTNEKRFALTESQADRFRNSLRLIIVDVFDGEGYVALSFPENG